MTIAFIENDTIRVGISPDYGARVVSLVDKASGREWMARGGQSENTGEEAVYWGEEAVGWDECFPTVSRWDASATPWRRRLRDHGDLWGRPWRVDAQTGTAQTLTYETAEFRFTRALRVEGGALIADYSVANLSSEPLPYLWALHALLAVEAGDRIELPGVDQVRSAYVQLGDKVLPTAETSWSERGADLPFALADVQPRSARFAGKFYASGLPGGSAVIGRPGQRLAIVWDASISDIGIWLTYGLWPAPGSGSHQEIAVEPTNAPADHAGQAIAHGAPPLAVGEERRWTVTLSVRT